MKKFIIKMNCEMYEEGYIIDEILLMIDENMLYHIDGAPFGVHSVEIEELE